MSPSTMSQIMRTWSSIGRPSLAISDGLVVTPSTIPQLAPFFSSSKFAVSKKNFTISLRLSISVYTARGTGIKIWDPLGSRSPVRRELRDSPYPAIRYNERSQYSAACMKRFFLVPFAAFTLLQLAGIAAPPPQPKTTSRAAPKKKQKKLPYQAKVPGVDPTMGDD